MSSMMSVMHFVQAINYTRDSGIVIWNGRICENEWRMTNRMNEMVNRWNMQKQHKPGQNILIGLCKYKLYLKWCTLHTNPFLHFVHFSILCPLPAVPISTISHVSQSLSSLDHLPKMHFANDGRNGAEC